VTEFEVLDGKRVVDERENLTPGLHGSFTVDLESGKYTTPCPNGDRARGVLVVTGARTAATTVPPGTTTKVPVRLSEFRVRVAPATIPAGPVSFAVKNAGGLEHEVVIVRGSDPAALPVDADGAVDEDRLAPADQLGELEDLTPKVNAKFDAGVLAPGTYVLFCNIVSKDGGETLSHYAEGMHAFVTVR
jgi:hypothetical protein